MKNEKETLESITGSAMKGIRQHYLNYDNRITPEIQYLSGFKYDSSIGYKPDNGAGFRRGASFPFKVMLPSRKVTDLLEIPLIIMDGALDKAIKIDDCYRLVEQTAKYGGVLTILWHTNRFNTKEYPAMLNSYAAIVRDAQSKGAWTARAEDVYDWITNRPIR
jgi:peptidoglycan/xylan/chitin deacetylase (PgdA/CDA1 family)